MNKNSLIRTIYLYLFTLVGLTLLVIGGVMLVNLGLKMTIFKQADIDRMSMPPTRIFSVAPDKTISEEGFVSVIEKCEEKCELDDEQKQQLDNWLSDYQMWQKQEASVSYTTQRRQQSASSAIAMILIGLPLYLYHWTVIKKENKQVS